MNRLFQDSESENISLKEWMSKTNVKMAGKENLKPITCEVGEVASALNLP